MSTTTYSMKEPLEAIFTPKYFKKLIRNSSVFVFKYFALNIHPYSYLNTLL